MKRRFKRLFFVILGLLLLAFGGLYVYSLNSYQPDLVALDAYQNAQVSVDGSIHRFRATQANTGLILYPGGLVEAKAYAHVALSLSQAGVEVFIVEMPFNLAVFNLHGANAVRSQNQDIQHWFLAGHSLGGAMASAHMAQYALAYEGLILLAAYPINDAITNRLIIYGDRDGVLDFDALEPFLSEAEVLVGGNHANFGNYGSQNGDNPSTLTQAQQQALTQELILNFIRNSCPECQVNP